MMLFNEIVKVSSVLERLEAVPLSRAAREVVSGCCEELRRLLQDEHNAGFRRPGIKES